ncbi:MAG: ImmA/IrrE family metallo-endopeptidase [Verrucomicrobiaceae bacterium]|nr:MAG: ImmA/IrrE family metallo-endopeptidase [Verrucomicrobiaceae bacterium]
MGASGDNIRPLQQELFPWREKGVIPERITQVRELRGLTKSALADHLGVSPGAITQWENGSKRPDMSHTVRMARLLAVPAAYFQSPIPPEVGRIPLITFRSTAAARLRRLNLQASRLAELAGEAMAWVCRGIALPECRIPNLEALGGAPVFDAGAAAMTCRRELGLGDRPIHQLAELMESKGVLVVPAKIGGTGFDAFSCVVNARPFIFLGTHRNSRSRTRFDTAHELAHLVLHQHISTDDLLDRATLRRMEQQADAFAGAFLMPGEAFLQDLRDLREVTLPALLRLKPKWGASLSAMVRRAYDLGRIDTGRYTVLNAEISSKGWKGKRPEPCEEEVPPTVGRLAAKCLRLVHSRLPAQTAAMSAELPLPTEILCDLFAMPADQLHGMLPEPRIIPMPGIVH